MTRIGMGRAATQNFTGNDFSRPVAEPCAAMYGFKTPS
jgi:hypothetical protein